MANYNYSNVGYKFDDSGGVARDVEVLAINGINVKAETQDVTPNGVAYMKKLFGGLVSMDEIVLTVLYDDVAAASGGTDALFIDVGCVGTSGGTRTFKITYGSTKYTSVEVIIGGYDRKPVKGSPHTAEVTLVPTGTITEN